MVWSPLHGVKYARPHRLRFRLVPDPYSQSWMGRHRYSHDFDAVALLELPRLCVERRQGRRERWPRLGSRVTLWIALSQLDIALLM